MLFADGFGQAKCCADPRNGCRNDSGNLLAPKNDLELSVGFKSGGCLVSEGPEDLRPYCPDTFSKPADTTRITQGELCDTVMI